MRVQHRRWRTPASALLLGLGLLIAASGRAAMAFGIGDKAPALTVSKYVKGKPITLGNGKISVVEFWATWCGPCKVSIPHLTQLAKKNPQVQFVGVSVWETDTAKVVPFVKEMGAKMDYAVAMDVVPDGAKGNDGAMAKGWMTAAGQNGIPTAFIVDGSGTVAWIGHPMAMEEPLAKIVAGKWDVAAAAAKFKADQAREVKMMALSQELRKAMTAKDYKGAIAILDAAIAEDASMEATLGTQKFALLRLSGDSAGAAAYGRRLIGGAYKGDAMALNSLAWEIVDPDAAVKPDAWLLPIGLEAALAADTAAGSKDAAIVDTLAAAYFANGDIKKAIATQEKAVKIAGASDPTYQKNLDRYRAAATAAVNK